MAINSSRTRLFSIATIVQRAYQIAGLMNPLESTSDPAWTAKAGMAADFLDMGLKAMQASSILEKHVYKPTVTIVAGTATYSLDTSILAVIETAMFSETGETTQSAVSPIDRQAYQAITDKTSEGSPSRYWFDRYNHQISLWPVPDTAGSLVLQAHRLIADGNDTQYDVELERHWTEYLVFDLAYKLCLANSLPLDRTSFFRVRADQLLREAQGYSKSSEPFWLYCAHSTPWSK